ncbi:NAD(P)/FAD-dependent oxidoreductase [Billgrantia antri]|uniref:FAD-binding oxidoreductase n=1 Tax=Billgrantia antri TaxID=2846777 RepID=A0ABS6ZLT7_9GAMM|nr:FAD-dependent oxidoreductase [Halomonas antri]MBW6391023.1 FAD-binding oxidoreductase [Halomonas antri]
MPACENARTPATDSRSIDADIVVVGAGIVGVACTLALSRQGWRVLVLDKDVPARGASWGNAGHMATEQVFPIADASILMQLPRMLLDPMGPLRLDWRYFPQALPWFTRLLWNLRPNPYQNSVAGIRALNERSLGAWQRLLSSLDESEQLKADGSFLIYEKPESRDLITALGARMSQQGVDVEAWQGDTIRKQAPQLSDHILGGLFFPRTGHVVDPGRVVKTLIEAAKHHGAIFEQEHLATADTTAQGVKLITQSGKRINTRRMLLAAGAHSGPLTRQLTGVKIPLDTERGYHLMLPEEQGRLPVAVTSFERRFIMTPMAEGLRLAGTVEFAGLQRPARMQRAWQLHRLSQGLFKTDLDVSDATPWMGFRPSLPDSLPIIDSVNGGKVLLAFGHHHLGLTQAAITADIITHLTNHGDPSKKNTSHSIPDLRPYRLDRFS